ncbi:hypothetical protein [Desulfosporosinus shakirovi]|uniref:hypothetical protein n=1 Tax=Desulfosporosinus shakirovi TaxID=2885154 RepID=UPI001E498481|nr:hypothetical protein [Desulfosporosinus sp. SRJS8]MCB8817142.1 hypothetical protein [Desulfosporosinus sp. SRJS8]
MDSETKKYITVIVLAILLIILVRFAIPFKIIRVIRKSEYVRDNLNNKNVRNYISFLGKSMLINAPEVGQALRETQLVVNEAMHIDGRLKLALYQVLMRKRIMGVQEINPIYLDKDGNRI